jgi:hypothetical protein
MLASQKILFDGYNLIIDVCKTEKYIYFMVNNKLGYKNQNRWTQFRLQQV